MKLQIKKILKELGLIRTSNVVNLIDQVLTFENPSPVFKKLTANGTNNSSNSIMSYGVNVFTTASSTDFCTKLPQPTTGRKTVIINKSSQSISVHPSNVGGQINLLAVDTPLVIPNDGKSYEFICTENPLPGGWNVVSPPATSQLAFAEISINHTNGTATSLYGYSDATLTASGGIGIDGQGNVVLTGNHLSENTPTTVTKMKVYSNAVTSDMASDSSADDMAVVLMAGGLGMIGGTLGGYQIQIITAVFGGINYYNGLFSQVGTLNSPLEVGDTDTIYRLEPPLMQNGVSDQIGTGGAFSRYYYTLAFGIPASAATKTYKFQVFLEYV